MVLDFLNQYRDIIVGVGCALLTIVCMLIKRKPKTLDDFLYSLNEVVSILPKTISYVEVPGKGNEKKVKVINASKLLLTKKLGRSLSESESIYFDNVISEKIEDILSTPQKKVI